MARNDLGGVVRTLRRTMVLNGTAPVEDAELLEDFVAAGDQGAFEALVRRYGPMVMGVCRRIVQNGHDAEDAFQATFLILARKAASLARRELLSGWLYGVAYRVARRSRTMAARRHLREKPYIEQPGKDEAGSPWSDLEPILDQELQRLPKSYQLPILLCDLQGKSRRDAATEMGVPEGTLSSRLARGRDLLRQRLTRRGIALSTGTLTALLANEASGVVPGTLLKSTARAATAFASGPATGVAVKVVTLAESGLKSLLLMKLQIAGAVLLTMGVVTGLIGFTRRSPVPEMLAKTPVAHGPVSGAAGLAVAAARPGPEHDVEASVDVDTWEMPEPDGDDAADRPSAESVERALLQGNPEVGQPPVAARLDSTHCCRHGHHHPARKKR